MTSVTVRDIVDALGLEVAAGADHLEAAVTGGYASDLLSCVMAGAKAGNCWVTLQAHLNVIAVATLLDLACVIIAEGVRPEASVVQRAEDKGVPVLLSPEGTFSVVVRLAEAGVDGAS